MYPFWEPSSFSYSSLPPSLNSPTLLNDSSQPKSVLWFIQFLSRILHIYPLFSWETFSRKTAWVIFLQSTHMHQFILQHMLIGLFLSGLPNNNDIKTPFRQSQWELFYFDLFQSHNITPHIWLLPSARNTQLAIERQCSLNCPFLIVPIYFHFWSFSKMLPPLRMCLFQLLSRYVLFPS